MKQAIIDFIKRNRVSTTEVADCLEKSGAIPHVLPLNRGHFRVGPVRWVYAHHESNWPVHEQIRGAQAGEVILVESFACGGRAIFGDLVSKFLVLYRQVEAVVVVGPVRDAPRMIKENWPVWCSGITPIGCFNSRPSQELDPAIVRDGQSRYQNAVAVCDDCGVVIIPSNRLDQKFLELLENIEAMEDIWYECIDKKKWDTFNTICLKRYEQPKQ